MKRIAVPLLLCIVLISLQATLAMFLPIQKIRPDFVLILTFYLALSYPPISGGFLASMTGCLTDVFSGNVIGLYTVTRPLLFYAVQGYRNRFYMEGFPFQFVITFAGTLGEGLLVLILLFCLNPSPLPNLYPRLFTVLVPPAFATSLLAPFLFSLFDRGSHLIFTKADAKLKEP